MRDTYSLLVDTDFPPINRKSIETLQANLGYLCNMRCQHCHVNAGPSRTEVMTKETIDLLVDTLEAHKMKTLDLTGGAPEMNPFFKFLVSKAREMGVHVVVRCNLCVLFEQGQEDTAQFLADHGVEVVASLPCYSKDNVDRQRGDGAFEKSISALKLLNRLGYGKEGSGLVLNLVYNPLEAFLPPDQQMLEQAYKRELKEHFGIDFNRLFAIANMPINRFGSMLVWKGEFEPYMKLLKDNYSQDNLETVMCRDLISVDWQGHVYDCDFNQMLDMRMRILGADRPHLSDVAKLKNVRLPIAIADHCYGCTAGQGSSCGGALV